MGIHIFNQTSFARYYIKEVDGSSLLGAHRLTVNVVIDPYPQNWEKISGAKLVSLTAEAHLQGAQNKSYDLGQLLPITPVCMDPGPYPSQATLGIDLTSRQIEAIESIRAGGKLSLNLNLTGQVFYAQTFHAGSEQLTTFHIEQSRWISILERMNASRILLFEIALPEGSNPDFTYAIDQFKSAQAMFLRGEYGIAIGQCRKSLEALTTALQDKNKLPKKDGKTSFEDSNNWSKDERLGVLRRAAFVYACQAMHADSNAASVSHNREDAMMMMAVTAALLRHFEH